MENQYKPGNYNSLSPYFVIDGAGRFGDLLKELFEAKELRRYASNDGKILHMELLIDDTVIMMADSNEKFKPIAQLVHLYVPVVDKLFDRAKKNGCEIMDPPRERPGDPDKRGAFRDPFGNLWSVATQINK